MFGGYWFEALDDLSRGKDGKKLFYNFLIFLWLLSPLFSPKVVKAEPPWSVDRTTSPFLPRYMNTYRLFPRFSHGCYGGKILDNMFGVHSLSSTRFSSVIRNSMMLLTGLDYKCSEKLNHFNYIG